MATYQELKFTVTDSGDRVDKYIANAASALSRATVQKLLAQDLITVNGAIPKASYKVAAGDYIRVRAPVIEETPPQPEDIPLDILYEDDDIIAIDKPAGLIVHPADTHKEGTLVNALLQARPEIATVGDRDRPGIVHRLDKDTSGVVLVAKNETARRDLLQQFKTRQIRKIYLALLEGEVNPKKGIIDAPIGRDARRRQRMAVIPDGKPAITEYHVQEYITSPRAYTLVKITMHTGRTHQIRVHCAFIGHPVVGDAVYGYGKRARDGVSTIAELNRQFLHAHIIGFQSPSTGEYHTVTAPLAPDLQAIIDNLIV